MWVIRSTLSQDHGSTQSLCRQTTQSPVQDVSNTKSNSSWHKEWNGRNDWGNRWHRDRQQQLERRCKGVITCLHVCSCVSEPSLFLEYMIGRGERTKFKQRKARYSHIPCSTFFFGSKPDTDDSRKALRKKKQINTKHLVTFGASSGLSPGRKSELFICVERQHQCPTS